MYKKMIGMIFVALVGLSAGYNIYDSEKQDALLSDLAIENIEALADGGEGGGTIGGPYYWSKLHDCPGIGTGDYRACESGGSGNSCSQPGAKTCDCGRNCD